MTSTTSHYSAFSGTLVVAGNSISDARKRLDFSGIVSIECAEVSFEIGSDGLFFFSLSDVITYGGCDTRFSCPEHFLEFLARLPYAKHQGTGIAHSRVLQTPAGAQWWVSSAVAYADRLGCYSIWKLFQDVHSSVRAVSAYL
jgi:hypothetical protein